MPLLETVARAVATLALAASAAAGASGQEINNEAEIRHTIELEQHAVNNACRATLDLEYYQKGAAVHVDSALRNPDCAASSGTYTVEVRLKGDDGTLSKKTFDESWQRDDAEPVRLSEDYPVGDGVTVTRVRPRKLRCECSVDEAARPDQAPKPE